MSASRNCSTRTRPERNSRKAKKEAVVNVAESMHETPSKGVFFYKQWSVSVLPIA